MSLPLSGDGVAKILTVNDLDDYKKFRDALAGKKSQHYWSRFDRL